MRENAIIETLRRQQSSLAAFGSFALREENITKVLTEAARICARRLNVPYAKICRYRADHNDLVVVAGHGWHQKVIGFVISAADRSSTQGRAFVTGEPVVLEDSRSDSSYSLPPFYAEHKIVSTVTVPIKGIDGLWGVLEVGSPARRKFDEFDIVFLTGFANVIAEAEINLERAAQLKRAIAAMKSSLVEKDVLIAERAAVDSQCRELQMELLHVSRLSAMGQMTAAIAHELNQPLAAIANYIGAAKRTLNAPRDTQNTLPGATRLLERAQEQTLRAGGIIRNLKDMVEKRAAKRANESIAATVKASLALVMFGETSAKLGVKLELGDDIPAVSIDRVQIQQVLINLIRNSIEAMSRSSVRTLTLTTSLGEAGFANVTVRDTGPGLAPDVSARLFQPFNTSKNGGMGLGLTICQTLVEANGGHIWHVDDSLKGTAFRFCVPLVRSMGKMMEPTRHMVSPEVEYAPGLQN
jgi:signal transduction histidine kinase